MLILGVILLLLDVLVLGTGILSTIGWILIAVRGGRSGPGRSTAPSLQRARR